VSDEIQLVYRRKPRPIVYIRALPSTVKYPKDAQVELRILFARAAKKARGKKGLCLHPETLVITLNGIKKVCELKVGDMVLTHRGRFAKISEINEIPYRGEIVWIKPFYGPPVGLTPDHKVLAVRTEKCTAYYTVPCLKTCKSKIKELGVKVERYRTKRSKKGFWHKTRKCKRPYERYRVEWIPANEIKKGDLVCLVLPNSNEIREQPPKNINENLCELIGLYLAEGCTSENRKIVFYFGKHEKKLVEETVQLIDAVMNIKARVYNTPTALSVNVFSKKHAPFFKQFGNRSVEKKLPLWIFALDEKRILKLLEGFIKGDGHIRKDRDNQIVLSTSSPHLAWQIRLLLFRLNMLNSLRTVNQKHEIMGRPIRNPHRHFVIQVESGWGKLLEKRKNVKRRYRGYVENNTVFLQVKSVRREQYDGVVYGIKVEKDESLATVSFTVHNCPCHHLPWAAHYVLEELEGYASTLKREKKPVWKQRLEALENIIALVRKLAVTAKS